MENSYIKEIKDDIIHQFGQDWMMLFEKSFEKYKAGQPEGLGTRGKRSDLCQRSKEQKKKWIDCRHSEEKKTEKTFLKKGASCF